MPKNHSERVVNECKRRSNMATDVGDAILSLFASAGMDGVDKENVQRIEQATYEDAVQDHANIKLSDNFMGTANTFLNQVKMAISMKYANVIRSDEKPKKVEDPKTYFDHHEVSEDVKIRQKKRNLPNIKEGDDFNPMVAALYGDFQ